MDIQINVIPDFVNLAIQLVSTLFLYLILRHFLFKPVTSLLEKRKNYIEEGVRQKEEAEQELSKIQLEYDKKMLEARKESSEIISQARSYGEDLKQKAQEDSKAIAKEEYEKGILKLENEKQKAMKSLNDEIVNIALKTTEKVLRKESSKENDSEMIRTLIKDLENSNG